MLAVIQVKCTRTWKNPTFCFDRILNEGKKTTTRDFQRIFRPQTLRFPGRFCRITSSENQQSSKQTKQPMPDYPDCFFFFFLFFFKIKTVETKSHSRQPPCRHVSRCCCLSGRFQTATLINNNHVQRQEVAVRESRRRGRGCRHTDGSNTPTLSTK